MIYPAQITYLHIVKNNLKLTDEEYRDFLEEWTGKRSSKLLNVNEAVRVTENFDAMLKQKTTAGIMKLQPLKKSNWKQFPGGLSSAQYACIKAKQKNLCMTDEQLSGFIFHTVKEYKEPEDLLLKQASSIIIGLAAREKEKTPYNAGRVAEKK